MSVTVDRPARQEMWREVIRNHAENVWVIPLVRASSDIGVLSDGFGNVPERGLASWVVMTPGYLNPEDVLLQGPRGVEAVLTYIVRRLLRLIPTLFVILHPDLRHHPAAAGRLLRLPPGPAGRERVPRRPAVLRRPAGPVPSR